MTRPPANERCRACGGLLLPPDMMPGREYQEEEKTAATHAPDYICIICGRRYYWRGKPPVLVLGM